MIKRCVNSYMLTYTRTYTYTYIHTYNGPFSARSEQCFVDQLVFLLLHIKYFRKVRVIRDQNKNGYMNFTWEKGKRRDLKGSSSSKKPMN